MSELVKLSTGDELFPLSALLNLQAEEQKELTVDMPLVSVLQGLDAETYRYTKPGYWNSIGNDTDEDVTVYINGSSAGTVIKAGEYPTFAVEIKYVKVRGKQRYYATNDWDAVTDRYYLMFGLDQVELSSDYPLTTALISSDHFQTRWKEYFYDRYLAGETMEQWQRRLQSLADRTVPTYERAMRLYSVNSAKIDSDITMEQTTTYNDVKDVSSGSSYGKVSDTPDNVVNESDSYAGTVSKGSTGNTNTKSGSVSTVTNGADGILGHINRNTDEWRDLETRLMLDLGKVFLSIIWY